MMISSNAEEFHAAVAAAEETPLVACFSAPWCGGCKLVAPKVEKLAEELQDRAQFVNVSAQEFETLCEEVEVDSFPTFRVYKGGKVLGELTSSKFDKVDAFVRALVASEMVTKEEETPEADVAEQAAEETPEANVAEQIAEETPEAYVAEQVAEEVKDDEATEDATEEMPEEMEDEEHEEVTKEDAVEEEVVEEAVGTDESKKRHEREEMQSNDEHVTKKAKTEEGESAVVEESDSDVLAAGDEDKEGHEEAAEENGNDEIPAEKMEEVVAEVAEKTVEEVAGDAVEKVAHEVAENEETAGKGGEKETVEAAPVDKLETSEAAEAGAAPANAAAA